MASIILQDAAVARDSVTFHQQLEIRNLYKQWSDEIGERADYYAKKQTSSSALSELQARELKQMLRASSEQMSNEMYGLIKQSLYTVSEDVVANAATWLSGFGYSEQGMAAGFSSIPYQTVQNLITGNIYEGGWNLSSRIWGNNESTLADCYKLVAKGMAENMPIYDIAKILQEYVQPGAKKSWNLKLATKNTLTGTIEFKRIYNKQVDYNAQRLARTLVQHSYQQSFVAVTKNNPFVKDYIWSSNGSRVCPLCLDRDGQHFAKDDLPLDHPNGMCIMIPNVDEDGMINQLADWINNPDGTYPELDEFAKEFGYDGGNAYKASLYGTSWNAAKNRVGQNWYNAQKYMESKGGSAGAYWKQYINGTIQDETLDGILGFNGTAGTKATVRKVKSTATKKATKKAAKVVTSTASASASAPAKEVFSATEWVKQLSEQIYELGDYVNECNSWWKGLSDDQQDGVSRYTGNSYARMNSYLRFGDNVRADTQKLIRDCTSALQSASLSRTTIVRRGSDYNMLSGLGLPNKLTGAQIADAIGATVTDKGFTSTSPFDGGGFTYCDYEYIIKVPAGSQAMYVDPVSRNQGEQELLLQRGAVFRIEDVETNDEGTVKKIYMTLTGNKLG